MQYLYHAVPKNMTGSILYPLTALATTHPDIFEAHAQKYQHRPHVPRQRIPTLQNCLWNDVIFLTAIHPGLIKQELEYIDGGTKPTWRYFKIDPRTLSPRDTTVFLFKDRNAHRSLVRNDFAQFDTHRITQYATLPEATKEYWRHFDTSTGRPRLLYMHIPHILYRGTIDVSSAEIIEV